MQLCFLLGRSPSTGRPPVQAEGLCYFFSSRIMFVIGYLYHVIHESNIGMAFSDA